MSGHRGEAPGTEEGVPGIGGGLLTRRWGRRCLRGRPEGGPGLLGQLREVGALGVVLGLVLRDVAQRGWGWWEQVTSEGFSNP